MKYGLSVEEIKKLEDKGILEKNEKCLCLACYQEKKPLEKSYFGYIGYPHLANKHPELQGDYETPIKAYRALYHNTGKFSKGTRRKKRNEESWDMIKSEGIGNWSQRKLTSTALKLETIADEYIKMANIHKKANENEKFMECMEKARQCMDTVGKLVKPTAPSRSKIKNEEKEERISKADKKQMDILSGLAEKIKKDADVDMTKLDGAWHEPIAESA